MACNDCIWTFRSDYSVFAPGGIRRFQCTKCSRWGYSQVPKTPNVTAYDDNSTTPKPEWKVPKVKLPNRNSLLLRRSAYEFYPYPMPRKKKSK